MTVIPLGQRVVQLPRDLLMAAVRGYRFALSPWLGNACRFEPTCSAYALTALERHGALAGSYLTVTRLLRCQPFCRAGHDPVPNAAPGLFTRWVASDAAESPRSSPSSSAIPATGDDAPMSGTALRGRRAAPTFPEKTAP